MKKTCLFFTLVTMLAVGISEASAAAYYCYVRATIYKGTAKTPVNLVARSPEAVDPNASLIAGQYYYWRQTTSATGDDAQPGAVQSCISKANSHKNASVSAWRGTHPRATGKAFYKLTTKSFLTNQQRQQQQP